MFFGIYRGGSDYSAPPAPIKVRRKAHARHTSSKTTTGWEEYDIARKKVPGKRYGREEEERDMERRNK